MQYIHYGSNSFDISSFKPISNRQYNKPNGGLWASPIGTLHNEYHGWYNWCKENSYKVDRLNKSFTFNIDSEAKIFKIHKDEDLKKLKIYDRSYLLGFSSEDQDAFWNINFEQMIFDGYQAIEVLINTQKIYWDLYGWDCDSLLVFDPEIMIFK